MEQHLEARTMSVVGGVHQGGPTLGVVSDVDKAGSAGVCCVAYVLPTAEREREREKQST